MTTTSSATINTACRFCGNHHGPRCPEVRAIEYHPDGTVKRVEFLTPADHMQYPLAGPIYPQTPTIGDPWVTSGGTFYHWDGRTFA